MKNILVIGAGLSSSYLIKYLLQQATTYQWQITVADNNLQTAEAKVKRGSGLIERFTEADI